MATRGDGALRPDEAPDLQLVIDSTPSLIYTSLPDDCLDFSNQAWLRYVGRSLEHLQGWKLTEFIHPNDVGRIVAKWHVASW